MAAANPKILELDDNDRRLLESMLLEFDQTWTEDRLAKRLGELPPDSPLRLPALVEMVKIELEHQWKRGRQLTIEATVVRRLTPVVPCAMVTAARVLRPDAGRTARTP